MGRSRKLKKERAKEIKKEGIPPLQVLSRGDVLTAIILSTLTLIVYAFTAAPGVALADAGDFLNGVLTLGIVHPPGYPLYTVLGHLFSLLPFGEPEEQNRENGMDSLNGKDSENEKHDPQTEGPP